MPDSATRAAAGAAGDTASPRRIPGTAGLRLRALAGGSWLLPLAIAALYVIAVGAVARSYGPRQISLWGWAPTLSLFAAYGFTLSLAWRRFTGQPRPLAAAFRAAPAALALHFAVAPVLATHIEYKIVMHQIQPFFLDAALMRADWLLHLGRHPYQLVPQWPVLTRLFDDAYLAWFAVLFMSVTAAAWLASGRERARIFVAFFLCWALLGCILATLLSSAGPVYQERMGLSAVYVPLTNYLQQLDLLAVEGHEALWQGYIGLAPPVGISAMPSLHVAIPALFTIAAWRQRALRWLGIVFTTTILVGSVQLAWHYALDGYVAIAAVILIWWLSGQIVNRWPGGNARPEPQTGASEPHGAVVGRAMTR